MHQTTIQKPYGWSWYPSVDLQTDDQVSFICQYIYHILETPSSPKHVSPMVLLKIKKVDK